LLSVCRRDGSGASYIGVHCDDSEPPARREPYPYRDAAGSFPRATKKKLPTTTPDSEDRNDDDEDTTEGGTTTTPTMATLPIDHPALGDPSAADRRFQVGEEVAAASELGGAGREESGDQQQQQHQERAKKKARRGEAAAAAAVDAGAGDSAEDAGAPPGDREDLGCCRAAPAGAAPAWFSAAVRAALEPTVRAALEPLNIRLDAVEGRLDAMEIRLEVRSCAGGLSLSQRCKL
jgi:hypothetical protein